MVNWRIVVLLLCCWQFAAAQKVVVDQVTAREKLTLNGVTAVGISTDGGFASAAGDSLVTQLAVKTYVDDQLSAGTTEQGDGVTILGDGSGGDPFNVDTSLIVTETRLADSTAALRAVLVSRSELLDSLQNVIVSYDAGNGAHVWAVGYGITFSKNASSGEYTFAIPDTCLILRAVVDGDVADDDGNGEVFAAFNYSGTRTFNQDLATAWRPRVTVWDSGGSSPSRSSPKNMLPVNVQGISAVGSGNIEITLQNVSTITPNPVFEFNFL